MGLLKGNATALLKGNATARRGANGEVKYDTKWRRAKERALGELLRSEEAAASNTTSALYGGVGNVSGQPAGGSIATTTTQTQAQEGNPGMGDTGANADIDLSTSDTTIRRKAGYRRDSGIRI